MSSKQLRFDGQVAVVTGAGSNPGLGRSYALLLASRGAKLVVNDLGVGPDGRGAIGPGLDAVVREINDLGGEAIADAHSVAERDGARKIVELAVGTWGRLDIVINNAGIAPFAHFDEISDSDIERIVNVHLMGHIWMCRAAWPHMTAHRYGRLVNVSSGVAAIGMERQSIYAAAKLGVVGLTKVLAGEGEKHGIRANVIMPFANTSALQKMAPAFGEAMAAAGRVPEVVAPVAAWLAHQDCDVSGKTFSTQAGAISEVYISETAGTEPNSRLSLEGVREGIARALDRSSSRPCSEFTKDQTTSAEERS